MMAAERGPRATAAAPSPPGTVPLAYLAVLRIMMGTLFVTTWFANLGKGFYSADGLRNFFTHVYPQAHNPLALYAAFIDNALLPHAALFAAFQLVFELAIGVALLLGVLTPVVGVAAAFFLANIFLATFGAEWSWTYVSLIVVLLVVAFARAGRALGVDAKLLQRFGAPKLPLW